MKQQARNVAMHFADEPVKAPLLRDNGNTYTKEFDAILKVEGVEVKKVAVQAPKQNAYPERWVQALKQE